MRPCAVCLRARARPQIREAGGTYLEAPVSGEFKAGMDRFGFDEHEADPEPFEHRRGRR